MRTEIVHDRITHSAEVSMWDGRAHSLCGKDFAHKTFKEKLIYGSVDCPDCRAEKKAGKTL